MDSARRLLPPSIRPGDCIGLFSPAGPVRNQERFDAGLQLLHELGYQTKQYHGISASHTYLAADDMARAEEFHALWADPEVHAMIAVRGGYGCLRMMPCLNLELLDQNPKRVVGFSDLTVLLNTLVDRPGIIAFHGPVLTSLAGSDTESVDSFVSQLTGTIKVDKTINGLEILRGGTATGIIRGGNLTTIAHLLGTPWEIPFKNTLLFLEDTGEPMYKIDRILTQLYISGRLSHLSGLMLGTFDSGTDNNIDQHLQRDVWNRIMELTAHTDYPVWGKFPVGHRAANQTIPLGATATMDSSAGMLQIAGNNMAVNTHNKSMS
jgi:muramoyltetrapeptide carboxypeptidase